MKRLLLLSIAIWVTILVSCQSTVYTNFTIQKANPVLRLNGTGAQINFYNGDLILTQSSNLLTLEGGDFSLGANSLRLTGNQVNFNLATAGSKAIEVFAEDRDINIWEVSYNVTPQYGYYLRYMGTGAGNLNSLQLWTHGETGADVLVYNINQDGAITFKDNLNLAGATSGTINVKAEAVAGTNTLTAPAETGIIATRQNIADSLDQRLLDGIEVVAVADSTGYALGNYLPRTSAEALIESMASGTNLVVEFQAFGAQVKAIPIHCDMDASTARPNIDGELFVTAVYLSKDETITGARFALGVQGEYTADNNNRVGLYKVSGTTANLVASTANNADLYKGAQYSWINHPFSSSYSAEKGAYYIAYLYNYSAQTTAPTIYAGESTGLNTLATFMENGVRLKGVFTSQTDLPSSFNMLGASTRADSPMIVLY